MSTTVYEVWFSGEWQATFRKWNDAQEYLRQWGPAAAAVYPDLPVELRTVTNPE